MPEAKIITFFSTKGGVGKTFLAVNLAVALAKEQAKKVLLVDLDLEAAGDIIRILDTKPKYSLIELSSLLPNQNIKREDFLIHKYHIDILAGILRPQQSPYLEAKKIKEIFRFFSSDYDYIVIDAGKTFNQILIPTFEESNLIILVVNPDILSVYQTRLNLEILQNLGFPLKMFKVILNRAEAASSISWQEVSVALPSEIIMRIPSEGRAVLGALNRAVPLVLEYPKSKVSLAIKKLAEKLIQSEEIFILQKKELKESVLEKISLKKADFWKEVSLAQPPEKITLEEKTDEFLEIKRKIHSRLIEELKLRKLDPKVFSDPTKTLELKEKAEKVITNLLLEEAGGFISSSEVRQRLKKEIIDEALGLGPLEDFLKDPEITDIMVNNKDEVYIERRGKIELTSKKFISNEQVRTIIERIIAPIGRHIDESVPMVDARLPDGSRVNAVIPPLSLTGPTLTIRKFRKEILTVEELIKLNTLDNRMADFLKACVLSRKNMIVSGGTGSGKTTMLNVLSSFIPDNERIITIEDAAELKLHQQHWIRLESRPPNIEGKGAITIRDLFRNSLRMRPDRIIIGECRGEETLDMLQAMNTGHDGSMTTLHANSTQDVLARLDSMILMSGTELPIRAIREMVASAIDIIVHTARLPDGTRKIIQITEVAGMLDEIHINLKDIFVFQQTGVDSQGNILGYFKPTGYIPTFFEELKVKGLELSEEIFKA